MAREGPCHSCPMAAPKSTLAVRARAVQSAPAALEAMSGSAASPPCAPDRHSCAPKRPPALDGIGHRLRRDTRRSHRSRPAGTVGATARAFSTGGSRVVSVSGKAFKGRWCWLDIVCGGRFLVLPTAVRPAEALKALDGKHARRSNAQSVRRAPAPPSPFGHDASLVTPSLALQQLRRAPRPCSHHAHR